MPATSLGVLDTITGLETLTEIGTVLDGMWSVHEHVPDAVRTQVGIAVGEIGANIIEHAGRGLPVRLRMEVQILPNEVHVEFVDDGHPAGVDLDSISMPDDLAESGRGLALAKAVMDRLCYARDLVNHWSLVSKRFA